MRCSIQVTVDICFETSLTHGLGSVAPPSVMPQPRTQSYEFTIQAYPIATKLALHRRRRFPIRALLSTNHNVVNAPR